MKESEILKLFSVIQNTYNAFIFDRFKTELWLDLLQYTPFELAQDNLRRYILSPENRFPPHPGILAEIPELRFEGNYVPNVQDTIALVENQRLLLIEKLATAIPESAMERMRQLGYKPSIERSD